MGISLVIETSELYTGNALWQNVREFTVHNSISGFRSQHVYGSENVHNDATSDEGTETVTSKIYTDTMRHTQPRSQFGLLVLSSKYVDFVNK